MTFAPVFQRPFAATFDRRAAAAAAPWYLAGGAPTPVAAYQPKNAASLAASYVNLANPGTYDAAPGVAPTFDAATGWTFTGTQWLTTGYAITNTDNLTCLVRFSSATSGYLCGITNGGGSYLTIQPTISNVKQLRAWPSQLFLSSPPATNGVIGLSADYGYFDGTPIGNFSRGSYNPNLVFLLGTMDPWGWFLRFSGNIQAASIYNTTLTTPQIAAVSAAMAAL